MSNKRLALEPADRAIEVFARAKAFVLNSQFAHEVRWQETRRSADFSETDLLRETAWVILCAGFRELAIRKRFGLLSLCFCDWESAAVICKHESECRATALECFKNRAKIEAILLTASHVSSFGFAQLKRLIQADPLATLRRLPWIGPVTCYHLAKNLGFPVAKPDRHLVRLASNIGFADPHELCQYLAAVTNEPIQAVDLILWRYSEQRSPTSSRPLA